MRSLGRSWKHVRGLRLTSATLLLLVFMLVVVTPVPLGSMIGWQLHLIDASFPPLRCVQRSVSSELNTIIPAGRLEKSCLLSNPSRDLLTVSTAVLDVNSLSKELRKGSHVLRHADFLLQSSGSRRVRIHAAPLQS